MCCFTQGGGGLWLFWSVALLRNPCSQQTPLLNGRRLFFSHHRCTSIQPHLAIRCLSLRVSITSSISFAPVTRLWWEGPSVSPPNLPLQSQTQSDRSLNHFSETFTRIETRSKSINWHACAPAQFNTIAMKTAPFVAVVLSLSSLSVAWPWPEAPFDGVKAVDDAGAMLFKRQSSSNSSKHPTHHTLPHHSTHLVNSLIRLHHRPKDIANQLCILPILHKQAIVHLRHKNYLQQIR